MLSPNNKFSTWACLVSSSLLLGAPSSSAKLVVAAAQRVDRDTAATDPEIAIWKQNNRRTQTQARPRADHQVRTLGMGMMMKTDKSAQHKEEHFEESVFVDAGIKYYHDDYHHHHQDDYYAKGKGKGGGMMMMGKKSSMSSKGKGKGKGKGRGYHDDYYYYYHDDLTHKPTQAPTQTPGGAAPATSGLASPASGQAGATFKQTMGCYAEGKCIYSHNPDESSEYLLDDSCSWTVTNDAILSVEYFYLEDGFDFLTVNGVGFTGDGEGLNGLPVFEDDELLFQSDFLNAESGFKVCLADPL